MSLQKKEAPEEEKTATEIIPKAGKTTVEENEKRMLYLKEEEVTTGEAVQKTQVKRESEKPEETVMDREIKNVLEEELLLTGSKAGIFVEENAKDLERKANMFAKEDAKDLFEQVEELLDNTSWHQLIQHCLQNL